MLRRAFLSLGAGALVFAAAGSVRADATPDSVSGRWQTVDDKTGKPGAIVRTYVQNGKLYGIIEKILKEGKPQDVKCTACSGYFKDKPVVGMVFMWDLAHDGDDWSGGSILDPDSGDVYKCKVTPHGDTLDVRGYMGISLLGRTQTWSRVK